MHFVILVPLTIPEVEENEIENAKMAEMVKQLEAHLQEKPDSIMGQIYLERYRGLLSSFARTVDAEIEAKMEPFGENNEEYFQFFDYTDDLRSEFENDSADCVKMPGGNFVPLNYHCYPVLVDRFIIKDGLVYQAHAGPLKHEKRTKKAKKMKAYPNYPYKKMFRTFEQYAKVCSDYDYDEKGQGYGYWCNPDAFWDWYVIGGRWPRMFLVKNECTEFSIGDRHKDIESLDAPDGFKWVVAARKKDIQWAVMKDWKYQKAFEEYGILKRAFETKQLPEGRYGKITEDGILSFGDMAYRKGEILEQFLHRRNLDDDLKYPVLVYGYLSDESYVDEYSLTGIEDKEERRHAWHEKVIAFLDAQDDDTVLVGVDYHM